MQNKITKKGFRGFTLLELLVVIAIIGILSTMIASPIQSARAKARDAKKIAEIKSVELALDQYAEANKGSYPEKLAELSPNYMPLLPSYATYTGSYAAPAKDQFRYVTYSTSNAASSTAKFGYHLGVHLEKFSPSLDTDRDCIAGGNDGSKGLDGSNVLTSSYNVNKFCVFYSGNSSITATADPDNTSGGPSAVDLGSLSGNSGSDFNGYDGDISTCPGVDDCVFDVASQQ